MATRPDGPPTISTQRQVNGPDGREEKRKTKLEVCLRGKTPKYTPNSGPARQRITLLPQADSTAYITERILLPPDGVAKDGKPRPKRMTYIVGWRDLPAARLLVPAMEILQYVSPRELEAWETALEEELSEERAKAEELQSIMEENGDLPQKKKRGRPPAHAQIESAAAAELETEDGAKGRLKGGALSLSTPRKDRFKELEDPSGDDWGSPSRQIEREMDYANETSDQTGEDDAAAFYGDNGALELEHLDQEETGTLMQSDIPQKSVEVSRASSSSTSATPDDLPVMYATRSSWAVAGGTWNPNPIERPLPPTRITDSMETTLSQEGPSVPVKRSSSSSRPQEPTQKKRRTSSKKTPKPTVDENGEEQWVVKAIEDDALYEVDGQGPVRHFLVRWEGDWPPDQNPTWEPEDNITPALVRNYFKRRKEERRKKRSVSEKQHSGAKAPLLKQTKLSWAGGKRYKSISEAFAGDEKDIIPHEELDNGGAGVDIDVGDDRELFVVDAQRDVAAQSRLLWREHRNALLGALGSSNP